MRGLSGRVSFVTGGGSGIGAACAARLAEEGSKVAVVDIRAEAAEETTKRLADAGGEAVAIACDVSSATDVERAVKETVSAFGALHNVANIAGVALGEGGVVECEVDKWRNVMAVNLDSIFLTGKYAIPRMREAGGGSIVNISSVFGAVGIAEECGYSASKGAVLNLTRHLALRHATENIRANAVLPSDCDTPLIDALLGPDADLDAEKQKLAEPIPMGRLSRPEEIAAAIAFLFSDDSQFITGALLPVDGGFLAQ